MNRAKERTLVTPEMAKTILDSMVKNRPIKRHRLEAYKQDMKNGTFDCYAPIAINVNGELADGQHRLQAIVETGIPQWFYIDTEMPIDAVYDRGQERTPIQSAYMRSLIGSDMTGRDVSSLVKAYTRTKYGPHFNITEDQLACFLNDYERPILDAIRISAIKGGSGRRIARRAPIQAVLFAAIIDGNSIDRLEEFAGCINSGIYDGDKDLAAIRFRNMFIDGLIKTGNAYHPITAAVTERALSDFILMVPRAKRYKVPTFSDLTPASHIFITPCRAEVRNPRENDEAVNL